MSWTDKFFDGSDQESLNDENSRLKAQIKELEAFIESLANDHMARVTVREWLRERKHEN